MNLGCGPNRGPDGRVPPGMDVPERLRPLLAAECRAESEPDGADSADLEQSVWLRWLERDRRHGPPEDPAAWLREVVAAEALAQRLRARREPPCDPEQAGPATDPAGRVEPAVLAAERERAVRAAVPRLPGRCPGLLTAMLSPRDLTYREIAGELGISQGSLGPMRSRCLGCLRRILTAEVGIHGLGGRVR